MVMPGLGAESRFAGDLNAFADELSQASVERTAVFG
jgi:hypothetical protein